MMQNILAGAALGSIITALIGLAWHRAAVADLSAKFDDLEFDRDGWANKYFGVQEKRHAAERECHAIIDQFKDGKSGTAKLAVKIARGEVE